MKHISVEVTRMMFDCMNIRADCPSDLPTVHSLKPQKAFPLDLCIPELYAFRLGRQMNMNWGSHVGMNGNFS